MYEAEELLEKESVEKRVPVICDESSCRRTDVIMRGEEEGSNGEKHKW